MGDLAVTVRLRGRVVEDRVLPVSSAVRLGERFGAAVSFPGADLLVVRDDDALLVRGQRLREGEELEIALGAVDVRLSHVVALARAREQATFDLRFLLAALLVAALGTWLDAATGWMGRHPPREGGLRAWVEGFRPPPTPGATAAAPATLEPGR